MVADLTNARSLFFRRVSESEQIVSSVEALWQTAPLGSRVRRDITEDQLCALYEMAYLSVFGHWENFIEECLVRMLSGQGCSTYTPALSAPPRARSLGDARLRVLAGKRFALWYDPVKSADRIAIHVTGSPLEAILRGSSVGIEQMAAVRHAIAHKSDDALAAFRAASLALAGVSYGNPGRLLRSQDHSDPLNPVRWLRKMTTNLRDFASTATR